MDLASHRLANQLVGNSSGAATLEATLVGPALAFEEPITFSVTGAEFDLRLDEEPIETNTCYCGRPGQRLDFGDRQAGARAYVAVAGGFEAPQVFGSRSTHVPSGMGGMCGRALRTDDRLDVGEVGASNARAGTRRSGVIPLPREGARVRVILGPQAGLLGREQVQFFEQSRYRITPESDRMGYRLEGRRLETPADLSPISSAVALGTVQVPPSGLPIVLLADHQTTGGYLQIATVISADIPVVGQLMASNWIEFEACTQAEALRALIAQERALMA
jgi:biotin-dependent carboxylase-like uncharacterized protein